MARVKTFTDGGYVYPADLNSIQDDYDDKIDAVTLPSFNAQVGTTYTLVLADRDKIVTLDNAAAITVTIPTNASVAFAVGTSITFVQLDAGQVLFDPDTGVTLNSYGGADQTAGQYAVATLIKTAADEWLLTGAIV